MSNKANALSVLVNGRNCKTYGKDGRVFIEGRKGSEYSIRITNDRIRRVLAVITVDGINVISGNLGGDGDEGYVIEPFSKAEIKGFRTSESEVHPFLFSDKDKSYAAKTDTEGSSDRNCGVIAVKLFQEYRPEPTYMMRKKSLSPDWDLSTMRGAHDAQYRSCLTSCASLNEVGSFDLGTKFADEAITDTVTTVSFTKGSLIGIDEIYYASFSELEKMGVIDKSPKVAFPQAFPERKFCKPPKK
jgi:hypothetical protein